jgi:F-type H+-transporting ATPase subunit b
MQLDWMSFFLEIVNFLVLVWILQHFLYRPVLRTIAARKALIERSLAEAAARQADAQGLERQYRGRLEAWEREKDGLRESARAELEAEREKRLAALRQALEAEREKHRVIEERAAARVRERLAEDAAAEGARFAARLLGRIAAPALEARVLEAALADRAALPAAEREAIAAACRGAGGEVRVASAFALSAAQRAALLARLAAATGAPVSAAFEEDPALGAGIRVRAGPWVLHANLRDELRAFAEAGRREG